MTKRAFDKIMAGVNDARAYLDGTANKTRYRVHGPRRRKPAKGRRARRPHKAS